MKVEDRQRQVKSQELEERLAKEERKAEKLRKELSEEKIALERLELLKRIDAFWKSWTSCILYVDFDVASLDYSSILPVVWILQLHVSH